MGALTWVIAIVALGLVLGAIAVAKRRLGEDVMPKKTPGQELDEASIRLRDSSSGWISRGR